jgi:hypothetical protein
MNQLQQRVNPCGRPGIDRDQPYRSVADAQRIRELNTVQLLVKAGVTVICAGGGGIPVIITPQGGLRGVEAVIDKEKSASSRAATGIDCADQTHTHHPRIACLDLLWGHGPRCIDAGRLSRRFNERYPVDG